MRTASRILGIKHIPIHCLCVQFGGGAVRWHEQQPPGLKGYLCWPATAFLKVCLAAVWQRPAEVCMGRRAAYHRTTDKSLPCNHSAEPFCRASPPLRHHAGTSSSSACASPMGCAGSRMRLRPWPHRPPCTPSSIAASPAPTRAACLRSGSPSRTFHATPPPLWQLCWCLGVRPNLARWWPQPHAQKAQAAFQRRPCRKARRGSLQMGALALLAEPVTNQAPAGLPSLISGRV